MNKKHALFTFLLAMVVRLGTCWKSFLHPQVASGPDAIGYHELAAALWQGRFPSLFRTPGYPLFLALTGATSSDFILWALLAQILLDGLTTVLLMAIAQRLWQHHTATLLTGLSYALCPVMATSSGDIANEVPAVFLVTAALFLLFQYRSGWSVVAQALLWFAATMTRPSYALLPVVASVFFLLQARLAASLKRQVVVLSLYAALTGGWMVFNYARAGMLVLSSNPDVSFYIYDTAALRLAERVSLKGYIRMALLNPPKFDRQLEFYQIAYASEEQTTRHSLARDLWFSKDDPALIRAFRAEAVEKTKGRLPLLIGIHLTGVLQSLRPRWNSVGWFLRILDGLRILLLPIALLLLLRQRQWWWLAFFTVWLVYALLPPGPVGSWRFRSLLEPFISLTLAFAWMIVAQRRRSSTTTLPLRLESDWKSQSAAALSE